MLGPLARLASLATLATLILNTVASPIESRQSYGDPNDDAFYHPTNLASFKPGDIIANRTVTTNINAPGSISYQISFRSTGNNGEATSSVATVWSPAFPVLSPARVFAFQYAEDSDNLDCNPSWGYVSGSASNAQAPERLLEAPIVIPWALNQGYYVVSTDAEGPLSSWLVGNIEGHNVLDAIRAGITGFSLDKTTTRVGLYGYSGGAHTTVWASALKTTYANELNIVGAAFGGTPVDLMATFNNLNNSTQSILAGAALFGLANGYPSLNAEFNRLLTPQGQAIAASLRSRGNCTSGSSTVFDYNTIFTGGNIINNPVLKAVLVREALLNGTRTQVPPFPRLEYHGTNDTTVPFAPEQQYVNQECTNDPKTDLFFVPFQGQDHGLTAILGLPGALSFVASALSGSAPVVSKCGGTMTMPPPGSQASINLLGSDRDKALQSAVAQGNSAFTA